MHIVQRYLERPLCFCGYKLDLRIYVLLVSAKPLRLYWFNDCLVRFATQKYDLEDLASEMDSNFSWLLLGCSSAAPRQHSQHAPSLVAPVVLSLC